MEITKESIRMQSCVNQARVSLFQMGTRLQIFKKQIVCGHISIYVGFLFNNVFWLVVRAAAILDLCITGCQKKSILMLDIECTHYSEKK